MSKAASAESGHSSSHTRPSSKTGKGGKSLIAGRIEKKQKQQPSEEEGEEEEAGEYDVEAILDKAVHQGAVVFLVKWAGYTEDDSTWEPESSLQCTKLIAEYEKRAAAERKRMARKINSSSAGNHNHGRGGSGGGGGGGGGDKPKLKRAKSTPRASAAEDAAAAAADEEEAAATGQWQVERIVGMRRTASGVMYRVKWKGWAETENTWQTKESFASPSMAAEYEFRAKMTKRLAAMDATLDAQSAPAAKCLAAE